jgi:hypothetical protein
VPIRGCFARGAKLEGTWQHLAELRSDVERELLETIEVESAKKWPALYLFNDWPETSHADVVRFVRATRERLNDFANKREAMKLAEFDAKHETDPRVLTGALAHWQDQYDTTYSAKLASLQSARESN